MFEKEIQEIASSLAINQKIFDPKKDKDNQEKMKKFLELKVDVSDKFDLMCKNMKDKYGLRNISDKMQRVILKQFMLKSQAGISEVDSIVKSEAVINAAEQEAIAERRLEVVVNTMEGEISNESIARAIVTGVITAEVANQIMDHLDDNDKKALNQFTGINRDNFKELMGSYLEYINSEERYQEQRENADKKLSIMENGDAETKKVFFEQEYERYIDGNILALAKNDKMPLHVKRSVFGSMFRKDIRSVLEADSIDVEDFKKSLLARVAIFSKCLSDEEKIEIMDVIQGCNSREDLLKCSAQLVNSYSESSKKKSLEEIIEEEQKRIAGKKEITEGSKKFFITLEKAKKLFDSKELFEKFRKGYQNLQYGLVTEELSPEVLGVLASAEDKSVINDILGHVNRSIDAQQKLRGKVDGRLLEIQEQYGDLFIPELDGMEEKEQKGIEQDKEEQNRDIPKVNRRVYDIIKDNLARVYDGQNVDRKKVLTDLRKELLTLGMELNMETYQEMFESFGKARTLEELTDTMSEVAVDFINEGIENEDEMESKEIFVDEVIHSRNRYSDESRKMVKAIDSAEKVLDDDEMEKFKGSVEDLRSPEKTDEFDIDRDMIDKLRDSEDLTAYAYLMTQMKERSKEHDSPELRKLIDDYGEKDKREGINVDRIYNRESAFTIDDEEPEEEKESKEEHSRDDDDDYFFGHSR